MIRFPSGSMPSRLAGVRLSAARIRLLLCAAVIPLFCSSARPLLAQQPQEEHLAVHGNFDRLAVHAENAPLGLVFQRIARTTGLQVVGLDKLSGPVTANFAGQPLREVVSHLLVEWDYALMEGDPSSTSARLPRLFILERAPGAQPVTPASPSAASHAQASAATPPHASGDQQDAEAVVTPEENRRITELQAALAKHDVTTLQAAISDTDPEIQREAFDLLNRLEPASAVSALVSATESNDSTIVIQSLTLLVQSDADRQVVLNALAAQLDNQDTSIKLYAIQSLADIGADAVDYLRQALSDPDRTVRLAVVQNAARGDWGIPLLQASVSDADPQIQQMAQRLLQQQAQQDTSQDSDQ